MFGNLPINYSNAFIVMQSTNLLAVDTGRTLDKKCCLSKIHFCGSFIKRDCYALYLLVQYQCIIQYSAYHGTLS